MLYNNKHYCAAACPVCFLFFRADRWRLICQWKMIWFYRSAPHMDTWTCTLSWTHFTWITITNHTGHNPSKSQSEQQNVVIKEVIKEITTELADVLYSSKLINQVQFSVNSLITREQLCTCYFSFHSPLSCRITYRETLYQTLLSQIPHTAGSHPLRRLV